MDRVSASEAEGWWFEPTRARQDRDDFYMALALREARRAARGGEVPVGAVVVADGEVVAVGHNQRTKGGDLLGHAEIVALRRCCRRRGDWRLDGACLYVTLEPCPMCVGAMLAARVQRVVFGAADPRCGSAGSVVNLADYPGMNHHLEVRGGVGAAESQSLLEEFFRLRRNQT